MPDVMQTPDKIAVEEHMLTEQPAGEEPPVKEQTPPPEPPPLFRPTKIALGYSQLVSGRGVFATGDIQQGELIERCPMVQLNFRSKYHKDPQLFTYLYTNGSCQCEECKRHGNHMYMVLGYGMLYNHQDAPNANWRFNWAENIADLIAQTDIAAGEEIFTSYGNGYFNGGRKKIVVDGFAASPVVENPLP